MLVKADHVKVYFKGKDKKSGTVKAVDDVSLHIMKGETFGGWVRAAAARVIWQGPLVRLFETNGGPHLYGRNGHSRAKGSRFKENAQKVQIILQDPSACSNPRRTVRQILMEPFEIHGMKGKMDGRPTV